MSAGDVENSSEPTVAAPAQLGVPLHRCPDIDSYADLARYVRAFRKDGYWIFRGVRQHNYRLLPKIGRDGARKDWDGNNLPYDPTQEERVLDHFKSAAAPYLAHVPTTKLEWLALAQHHGMVTRLLDWTESLPIAAWFAVEFGTWRQVLNITTGQRTTLYPLIYAVSGIPAVPTDYEGDLSDLHDVMIYHPPHLSPRIPAQRSVLTIHKYPDRDLFTSAKVVTFRIVGNPLVFKHDLNAAGINETSLFPGIDGLGKYAAWLYKWRSLAPTPELPPPTKKMPNNRKPRRRRIRARVGRG